MYPNMKTKVTEKIDLKRAVIFLNFNNLAISHGATIPPMK